MPICNKLDLPIERIEISGPAVVHLNHRREQGISLEENDEIWENLRKYDYAELLLALKKLVDIKI